MAAGTRPERAHFVVWLHSNEWAPASSALQCSVTMNRMPGASDTSRTLQVLAAAVTPVVLVSATAILISGVNARYIAIADRMRALSHEYREERCPVDRRNVISEEIREFRKRSDLVAWAVRSLYASVGCFITDAMIISATAWRSTLEAATLPFFVLGITLILISIILELRELQISARTIALEMTDIKPSTQQEAGRCT